jgi:hypothetical protein
MMAQRMTVNDRNIQNFHAQSANMNTALILGFFAARCDIHAEKFRIFKDTIPHFSSLSQYDSSSKIVKLWTRGIL